MFFTAVDYPISDIELSMVLGFIFHGFNAKYNIPYVFPKHVEKLLVLLAKI